MADCFYVKCVRYSPADCLENCQEFVYTFHEKIFTNLTILRVVNTLILLSFGDCNVLLNS